METSSGIKIVIVDRTLSESEIPKRLRIREISSNGEKITCTYDLHRREKAFGYGDSIQLVYVRRDL